MKTKLSIIQFPHSGQEPTVKGLSGTCPWNTGDHRRKFMKAKGKVVVNDTLSSETDVYFWGEWEPESRFTKIPGRATSPQYLHEPYFPPIQKDIVRVAGNCGNVCTSSTTCDCSEEKKYDNTDPFVFGDYFIYSNCRQLLKEGTIQRQTACLEIGSLILFGSILSDEEGPYFGLDTVFVVADKRTYTPATYKKDLTDFIPSIFPKVMLLPNWKVKDAHHTCYHGATFQKPCNGMYSFVPCMVKADGAKGFKQPVLRNSDFASLGYKEDILKDNNRRNFYRSLGNSKISEDDVKKVWERVKELIEDQGYCEGVELRLP